MNMSLHSKHMEAKSESGSTLKTVSPRHSVIDQLMFHTFGVLGSILAWLWLSVVLCPLVWEGSGTEYLVFWMRVDLVERMPDPCASG